MEAQRAIRSGGRPGFAVAVLILGLIALIFGGLLFFQLLTVEQFFAALILAFILALGIIFTIRARGAGGKTLAGILSVIVSVIALFAARAANRPPSAS